MFPTGGFRTSEPEFGGIMFLFHIYSIPGSKDILIPMIYKLNDIAFYYWLFFESCPLCLSQV